VTELPAWIADAIGPVSDVEPLPVGDSGNVCFALTAQRERWFVKWATTPRAVDGLRRAATVHYTVQHPAILPLESVLRSVEGTALLYPWFDGASLYAPSPKRARAKSAPGRFRALPLDERLAAIDAVFDAHVALAAAGFVSSDFYDGSLLYDVERRQVALIDLDEYRLGPFVTVEPPYGSKRFMAPEEQAVGGTLDARTTVFHLARLASILLDTGDDTGAWSGPPAAHPVALHGQSLAPDQRFPDVAAFVEAWRAAR
jgi:hypothetical protein